jgi:uncharacterized membrane protein
MEPDEEQGHRGNSLAFSSWFLGFLVLTIVLPALIIVVLPPDKRADGIATLAAVPILEYMAISIGVGLGVDPLLSFLLTVLPCIGICMLIMGLLNHFGERSERVVRFQGKVQKKIDKYPKVKRYGVVSSSLFVIFTGIYIGSGIAFILGWSPTKSLLYMALGIVAITTVIGLGTMGIIELFFI